MQQSNISFVAMTWERPPHLLERSLWTLSHQIAAPLEIVVTEASPTEARHAETCDLCSRYPLARLVEARWSRFNISRGINCGIVRTDPRAGYVATFASELLFSENFVEELSKKVGPGRYVRSSCAILPEGVSADNGPVPIREDWRRYCGICEQIPGNTHIAYGAVLCAERDWWFKVRGYDEALRPYSYPDIDVRDRARRSGLEEWGVGWEEAQVIHPWPPRSGLFYEISGYAVDARGADKEIVRNLGGWGEVEGDEPVRIPGT
jgi:hypothetical protein